MKISQNAPKSTASLLISPALPGMLPRKRSAWLCVKTSAVTGLLPRCLRANAIAAAELSFDVSAATPDGLPMVGWSARPDRLLAVGARRNGWLLAPLVARTIAAYLADEDPGPYAARLDPRRFDNKDARP